MNNLITSIKQCNRCESLLPMAPNPIFSISPKSKILIIGQAPGLAVEQSGIPWQDKSGDTLRRWLGVTKEQFYNSDNIALMPMGFCYPGRGKSGDLPPMKECAPQWHPSILEVLENIQLTLLIGKYAQDYYLGKNAKSTLTETVQSYSDYLPNYFVLPHPSPRNNIWMAKNRWFEQQVLPILKQNCNAVLSKP